MRTRRPAAAAALAACALLVAGCGSSDDDAAGGTTTAAVTAPAPAATAPETGGTATQPTFDDVTADTLPAGAPQGLVEYVTVMGENGFLVSRATGSSGDATGAAETYSARVDDPAFFSGAGTLFVFASPEQAAAAVDSTPAREGLTLLRRDEVVAVLDVNDLEGEDADALVAVAETLSGAGWE